MVVVAVFVSAVSGCHSGPSAPDGVDCWFSGITETTVDGTILSEDPDDWCTDGGDSYVLGASYPNPVSDITRIGYHVPTAGAVRIRMVAPGCRHVRTLMDTEVGGHASGYVVWDCTTDSGSRVVPGIYRCWLEADGLQCYGDILVLGRQPSTEGQGASPALPN
jgi:hypothetical protein